jgi:HK97 family phage prohead protease
MTEKRAPVEPMPAEMMPADVGQPEDADAAADAAIAECVDTLTEHVVAAAAELEQLKSLVAADAALDTTDDVAEGEVAPRSSSLTVEKRDGSSVSLRTMGGELRTVQLEETRSMTAPITVDETVQVDGPPVFRGHAAVFDMESQDLGGFRETIARGAFRKAIGEQQDTVALFNHDPNLVLGRTTNNTLTLREDPRGLHAEFEAPDTTFARDIRELVRRGDVSQMSFAFTVAKDDWQERSDGSIVRRVLEVDRLHDVSLVTSPAYLQTDAQSVRTDLTDDADTTLEPSTDAASAPNSAHEARKAQLLEQQRGAKRRLTLINAKNRMKG